MANTDAASDHNEAYVAFVQALNDPEKRASARTNPTLGPVLEKLSDRDLDTLAAVAKGQTLTNHGDPLAIEHDGQ